MPDRSPTLVLFDVDGTLVRTEGRSPHSRAFRAAFERVFESECRFLPGMHGMTDLQIFITLARNLGTADGRLRHLAAEACRTMLEIYRLRDETDGCYVALPGTHEVLDTLSRRGVVLGLVTGNDPEIARDKLTGAGLAHHFAATVGPSGGVGAGVPAGPPGAMHRSSGVGAGVPAGPPGATPDQGGQRRLPLHPAVQPRLAVGPEGWAEVLGAFGTEAEDRSALPPMAVARAEALIGRTVERNRVFVVGDTPRDVACALDNGCRAVAVATGHFSMEELGAAGAEVVLPSLLELESLLRVLQTRTE